MDTAVHNGGHTPRSHSRMSINSRMTTRSPSELSIGRLNVSMCCIDGLKIRLVEYTAHTSYTAAFNEHRLHMMPFS